MDVPYDRPYDINSDSAPGSINDSNLLGNINSPDPNNKSWFLRTFGQLNKGALRGAIFSLVASAIGAGCLTLPLVFESQGIILAVFLLAISIFISYYSLISIALAEEKHKKYNYPALTEVVLGMKWRYLLEISLILFVFGTIIAYQIMIGFILPSIGNSLNIDISGPSNRIAILCVVNVLMTPLSMFRDLSSLRFFTLFSTFSLALISLLIIAEFPMYALESSLSGVNWIKFDLKIINSFNLCLFSVNCHSNFSQVQGELFNTNIRRIKKVSMRSMGALFFTYFALGLFGYLSTIGNTPNLIIMRKAPKMVSNDFLMVIGRVLMVIILIVAVPIGIPSCRRAIIKLVFKQTGNDCPLWM